MTPRHHVSARVREVSPGAQVFVFLVFGQLYHLWPLDGPPGSLLLGAQVGAYGLFLVSPFLWARIPPLLVVTPAFLYRSESRVDLHGGGLIYHYDAVKRPLFLDWSDLESLTRDRFGLRFRLRPGRDVTSAMPAYQGQFWRGLTAAGPVRLRCVGPFAPEASLEPCLRAARAAGVEVRGFGAPAGAGGKGKSASGGDI